MPATSTITIKAAVATLIQRLGTTTCAMPVSLRCPPRQVPPRGEGAEGELRAAAPARRAPRWRRPRHCTTSATHRYLSAKAEGEQRAATHSLNTLANTIRPTLLHLLARWGWGRLSAGSALEEVAEVPPQTWAKGWAGGRTLASPSRSAPARRRPSAVWPPPTHPHRRAASRLRSLASVGLTFMHREWG